MTKPGKPNGWKPQSEDDHFMRCPVCHEWFDCRDQVNIGRHWHDGPELKPPTSETQH